VTLTETQGPPATADRHLPGQGGMWLFVIGDLWIFTCYFACYLYDRHASPGPFLDSQRHLNAALGTADTVLLLTSSLFVALAVQAVRSSRRSSALRLVLLGIACGTAFLVVKGFEWVPETRAGHGFDSNPFFMYYYALTGLHVVHVLLGLGILTWLARLLRAPSAPRVEHFETGATYWHMVDLLWVVIFALLYLLR
jgi:nitric oxide reductase NorE protein